MTRAFFTSERNRWIAPSIHADDMETIVELVGKLIEHMCVVSNSGEQNQSLACTAPIQDLKLDARLDCDEPDFMSRSIAPADIAKISAKYWPGDKASPNNAHRDQNPNLPFLHN